MIINKTIPPSLGEVVVQPKSQKHTQMSSKMGEKGIFSNMKNKTTPEKELKKKRRLSSILFESFKVALKSKNKIKKKKQRCLLDWRQE